MEGQAYSDIARHGHCSIRVNRGKQLGRLYGNGLDWIRQSHALGDSIDHSFEQRCAGLVEVRS